MSEALDPDAVTEALGVQPTSTQKTGDPRPSTPDRTYKKSSWWISTEGLLKSLDARDHLDWILSKLAGCDSALERLHSEEHLIDICVRWDSKSGEGGPAISPIQMKRLAELQIELWFDVYFDEEEEGEQAAAPNHSATPSLNSGLPVCGSEDI